LVVVAGWFDLYTWLVPLYGWFTLAGCYITFTVIVPHGCYPTRFRTFGLGSHIFTHVTHTTHTVYPTHLHVPVALLFLRWFTHTTQFFPHTFVLHLHWIHCCWVSWFGCYTLVVYSHTPRSPHTADLHTARVWLFTTLRLLDRTHTHALCARACCYSLLIAVGCNALLVPTRLYIVGCPLHAHTRWVWLRHTLRLLGCSPHARLFTHIYTFVVAYVVGTVVRCCLWLVYLYTVTHLRLLHFTHLPLHTFRVYVWLGYRLLHLLDPAFGWLLPFVYPHRLRVYILLRVVDLLFIRLWLLLHIYSHLHTLVTFTLVRGYWYFTVAHHPPTRCARHCRSHTDACTPYASHTRLRLRPVPIYTHIPPHICFGSHGLSFTRGCYRWLPCCRWTFAGWLCRCIRSTSATHTPHHAHTPSLLPLDIYGWLLPHTHCTVGLQFTPFVERGLRLLLIGLVPRCCWLLLCPPRLVMRTFVYAPLPLLIVARLVVRTVDYIPVYGCGLVVGGPPDWLVPVAGFCSPRRLPRLFVTDVAFPGCSGWLPRLRCLVAVHPTR